MSTTITKIRSVSFYKFDFDKRQLEIEDVDIIIPPKDLYSRKGVEYLREKNIPDDDITVKGIRSRDNYQGDIYKFNNPEEVKIIEDESDSLLRHKKIDDLLKRKSDLNVGIEKQDKNLFSVKVNGKFFQGLCKNYAYLMRISYKVPLEGLGPFLKYCGSIQPSDYTGIRAILGEIDAIKIIDVNVWASKSRNILIFNGSNPISFPDLIQLTNKDARNNLFTSSHQLHENLSEYPDRARYFSITVF